MNLYLVCLNIDCLYVEYMTDLQYLPDLNTCAVCCEPAVFYTEQYWLNKLALARTTSASDDATDMRAL